jgi:16S rRNA (guanine966-N2)-methyltransferase
VGPVRRRLRVVGGSVGSQPLVNPPAGVRPTTERVREALFNALAEVVAGRPFVDLYAGSGAVGIEALSRGASRALFVERSAACVEVIRRNLAKTALGDRAEVWRADVRRVWPRVVSWLEGEEGIVFADPPYRDRECAAVLAEMMAAQTLRPGTIVILEQARDWAPVGLPPAPWRRVIGDTCLYRWEV